MYSVFNIPDRLTELCMIFAVLFWISS